MFDKREAIGVGCFEGVGGIVKDAPKQTKQAKPVKGAEKDKTTTALAAEGMVGGYHAWCVGWIALRA